MSHRLSFLTVFIIALSMMSRPISAQEDLGWITELLPTGDDINIDKQLRQGAYPIITDQQVLNETFDFINVWDTSSDRSGNREVTNRRYEMRLRQDDLIYTGLGTESYQNSIISVDTQRLSTERNDGYGIVCRASDEDNGIHFYISSDGFWRIFAFERGRADPFTAWTFSDLIQQGEAAQNHITAVCVDDYFALYINGVLVGEALDERFTSGAVGLSVIVFEEASEVNIAFDDLQIWEASHAVAFNLTTTDQTIRRTDDILYDRFATDDNWFDLQLATAAEVDFTGDLVRLTVSEDDEYPAIIISNDDYRDVVVQAAITFEEGSDNIAYGLVCRLDEDANGYYFQINNEGDYTIWVATDGEYNALVDWQPSDALVVQGENHLTVACIEDYLAYFVNDTLLVELNNSLYSEGAVGFSSFTFAGNATVTVDDYHIWSARLD